MQHIMVILSIVLFCSSPLHADEMFDFVFGKGAPKPATKSHAKLIFDVCPINPPLGKDVFVVIVEANRFRRLGLWSKMDDALKQEAHAYFARGAVEDSFNGKTQLLVCGTEDVNDPRIGEIRRCLAN